MSICCDEMQISAVINSGLALDAQVKFSRKYDIDCCDVRFMREGESVGAAERQFSLADGVVSHIYFDLNEAERKRGLGSRFLRNSVVAYRLQGIRTIRTKAACEAGGYTWARLGFIPDLNSWQGITGEIQKRLNAVRTEIPQETAMYVDTLLRSSDPKSIWSIADMQYHVNGKPLGRFLLAGSCWNGFFGVTRKDCLKRLNRYIKSRRP